MAMDKKDISYRLFMMNLSHNLTQDNIADLKYFFESFVPPAQSEKISKGIDLFVALERADVLGPNKLDTLRIGFEAINRGDLLKKIEKEATYLANQFNEGQQSMQGMLEDEQMKKLHEDPDEWNVNTEVQVDVEIEVPQDTDVNDSSGNIRKLRNDPKEIIFGQSDVVPDGVGDTQPDTGSTSHAKNHKQQKPPRTKMPSELGDEGAMNVKGKLVLEEPLKPLPKQNKSITCDSDGVFIHGRGDERPGKQPSEDNSAIEPDLHKKSPSCGPDGESANKHGSTKPTESPSEDEYIHEKSSSLQPDGESASGHETKKSTKQPSEDECSAAQQKGKTIPVAPKGTEEDGPGGLAMPDFGSLAFNEDVSLPLNTQELTQPNEAAASSGAYESYSSQGEHSFDPEKIAQLNPQQQEMFASLLAAKCNLVTGGACGVMGPPFQGNSFGAAGPVNCIPYNEPSGPSEGTLLGASGLAQGFSYGASGLSQGTPYGPTCGASGLSQGFSYGASGLSQGIPYRPTCGASGLSQGTPYGPTCGASGLSQGFSYGASGLSQGISYGASGLSQGIPYRPTCGASGPTQGAPWFASYIETGSTSTQGTSTEPGNISGIEPTSCTNKEGFVVRISGGKHENTADGAKVIMPKSGVNFSINILNENPYDAELDICYGETYLGLWLLQPDIPLIVEGPSYGKGQLLYSAIDDAGSMDKLGSTKPSSVIKCTFKPDSEAIKLYVETAHRPGMNKERFEVVWVKSQSIQTLQEKVQKEIKTHRIACLVAHSELLQPPNKTLREAGVQFGDTIKVLFSEQKLYVKLPNGQLLEPPMTVNPLSLTEDKIKNYVQELKNYPQFRQRLTFQGQELGEEGKLIAVLVSEDPVIELEVAKDLTFHVKYAYDDNGEVKYKKLECNEHSFTTVKKLKNKVEQQCEDEVVLKLGETGLDDESKSLQDYGVFSGATVQADKRSRGQSDRSVMRGCDFGAWGSDDSDDDDFEWSFGNQPGTRGFSSTRMFGGRNGSRLRGNGDESPDDSQSEVEIAGKIIVTGDMDTYEKFVTDDVSRKFQEELKVVVRLKLVTRPSKTLVGACWNSTPEPLPVTE